MTEPSRSSRTRAMLLMGIVVLVGFLAVYCVQAIPGLQAYFGSEDRPRLDESDSQIASPVPAGDGASDDVFRTEVVRSLRMRVLKPGGSGVEGARATSVGGDAVLAVSDQGGWLTLIGPAGREGVAITAAGYEPIALQSAELVDGHVIYLRPVSGSRLRIRVLDEHGDGAPHVSLILHSGEPAQPEPVSHSLTDESGSAVFEGLADGQYRVAARLGSFDVSPFLSPSAAVVRVPGSQETLTLHAPNLAWVKPERGEIVTGYFRVPVSSDDFGWRVGPLRSIENVCKRTASSSVARAFMCVGGDVQFVGLLDPGGWTIASVPTHSLVGHRGPSVVPNASAEPIPFGFLTVRAESVDGAALSSAPFALGMSSAARYGAITLPVDWNVAARVPVGRYTLVALQGGTSNLFQTPQDAIDLRATGETVVTVKALRPVRMVRLQVEQVTRDGQVLPDPGLIRVSDASGFRTEVRPATAPAEWFPTGVMLTATTRLPVGLRYADLNGQFFVTASGDDAVTVRLREGP
ncbi:MAG: hypothetical protein KAI24_13615 [Planctomycetes bacterium]|nr:hypothetical protein [Planctomycetota bacterium]